MEKLTIQKKDLTVERLSLQEPFAWAQDLLIQEVQKQYNSGKPVRIIVLKARQLGISTATEGLLFNWAFLHPGTNGLVIAHETEASQHLFEMTQLYWETWPFKKLYSAKHLSQKRLTWEETRSSIRIATARNVQSGRGRTLHAVHCSECAFWEEPEVLMTGLNQTIPDKHGTIVVLESTANGVGNWFHSEWQAAERGESSYTPLFFPWYRNPEYSAINCTLHYDMLSHKEKSLLDNNSPMTLANLEWRRQAITTKCHGDEALFNQEYPTTPDDAFLTSGTNVFPSLKLTSCFVQIESKKGFLTENNGKYQFLPDPVGPLTIFKLPSDDQSWGQYFVAGDPTRTTMGDYACIQVINRRTYEQVAVWHGRVDPITFAGEIAKLGYFYNTAEVNTEITGPGYATIGRLVEMQYPRVWKWRWADRAQGKLSVALGWEMSYKRKHWAVGQVVFLLGQEALTIHDLKTYQQMRNYVVHEGGELGPARREDFDDAVTAFCIAVVSSMSDKFTLDPYTGRDEFTDKPTSVTDIFGVPPWEAFPTEEKV